MLVLDELTPVSLFDAKPNLSHVLSFISQRGRDDLFNYLSRGLAGARRPSGDLGFNLW
ncbi:MAG: hypothetical protein ABL996_07760 [Micropepsaceae bacterium]